jgi:hypothetical protein
LASTLQTLERPRAVRFIARNSLVLEFTKINNPDVAFA